MKSPKCHHLYVTDHGLACCLKCGIWGPDDKIQGFWNSVAFNSVVWRGAKHFNWAFNQARKAKQIREDRLCGPI